MTDCLVTLSCLKMHYVNLPPESSGREEGLILTHGSGNFGSSSHGIQQAEKEGERGESIPRSLDPFSPLFQSDPLLLCLRHAHSRQPLVSECSPGMSSNMLP